MKPKLLLCLALVLSGGLFNFANTARCADASSALKVTIDIPELWRDGKLAYPRTLQNRYPSAHFFIVMENVSSKPIFLRGENWIYDLSFEITDKAGKTTTIHHVVEMDSGKIPAALRLEPGETAVGEINYALVKYGQPAEWEKFPFPHNPHMTEQARSVTIRAVFAQSSSADTVNSGYSAGKEVSKPFEVILLDNAL